MSGISAKRARSLSLAQLGVVKLPDVLSDDNETLKSVRDALEMGFAGVILVGPPGTGKTVFASQIAQTLAEDSDAVRTVQFHTSYQYEDFMEGYSPNATGVYQSDLKTFPRFCEQAESRPNSTHVLLIDEISRCDVARVFGEALTYLEPDKRGIKFSLPSGAELSVPENLVILATMNPWDKGVDDIDVALERRFAQIDMPPSSDALRRLLSERGSSPEWVEAVVGFFSFVQALPDEMLHLGHAYFLNCTDPQKARRAWAYRLSPFFRRACRLDQDTLRAITARWEAIVPQDAAPVAAAGTTAQGASVAATAGTTSATEGDALPAGSTTPVANDQMTFIVTDDTESAPTQGGE
jgi:5-methylcytosine-specific restriction protein B